MIGDIGRAYAGAWRYALACPLLFAVPVAAEFVQHMIEMAIGMYDGAEGMRAAEASGARLGWGLVKTLSLGVAAFWVVRFLVLPGGAADARRFDPRAVRLTIPVLVWTLMWTVLIHGGSGWLGALGLDRYATAMFATLMVALMVLDVLLAPWKAAAALGNEALGFVRSIRLVGARIWWGLAFGVLAVLPPMALHYMFAFLAMGAPEAGAWGILALDALLVGYLGALMGAVNVAIARRAVGAVGDSYLTVPVSEGTVR